MEKKRRKRERGGRKSRSEKETQREMHTCKHVGHNTRVRAHTHTYLLCRFKKGKRKREIESEMHTCKHAEFDKHTRARTHKHTCFAELKRDYRRTGSSLMNVCVHACVLNLAHMYIRTRTLVPCRIQTKQLTR